MGGQLDEPILAHAKMYEGLGSGTVSGATPVPPKQQWHDSGAVDALRDVSCVTDAVERVCAGLNDSLWIITSITLDVILWQVHDYIS